MNPCAYRHRWYCWLVATLVGLGRLRYQRCRVLEEGLHCVYAISFRAHTANIFYLPFLRFARFHNNVFRDMDGRLIVSVGDMDGGLASIRGIIVLSVLR